ncbi:uncharacterized protein LOC135679993 [Musa acuminata AAA Group]|uniref:uncharacterized protein LOC135679993 n=1 Tax=Musa acuminata AAA Group TaxID=214697 RepID=UPI0031DE7611
MANVPAVQLLQAAKFVLSIAAGGFLLVCQRPMDYPIFVAAMYLLVIAAILLLYFSLGRPQLGSTVATTADGFRVSADRLLNTAKFVLCIAAGGFLLVCQRPMDFPIFVAAMYLLVIAAILLLYFSLGRPQLGSTVATTADGFRVSADRLLNTAKFVLCFATGGILLVCQRPTDFRSFVAAMYLMMTLGFLLLYLSLARPHLGSTTATTAADDSCVPTEQLLKVAKFVLAISTVGFLLVCQSPMDYPSYAMTMYLLMTLGFLLLYLSMCRSRLGWTTTS